MRDQQHAFACTSIGQPLDCCQHARLKVSDGFRAGRSEAVRVAPEAAQGFALIDHQVRSGAPFPIAEVQFAKVGLKFELK